MSEEGFTVLAKEIATLVNAGDVEKARCKIVRLVIGEDKRTPRPPDGLHEEAWGIIANAGGGNWNHETTQWQEAAARWRENYHARLKVVDGETAEYDPPALVPPPTSPSEALFAFMGWLTSRSKVSGPFSGSGENNSQAVDLIAEYSRSQGWAEPRPGWDTLIGPTPRD